MNKGEMMSWMYRKHNDGDELRYQVASRGNHGDTVVAEFASEADAQALVHYLNGGSGPHLMGQAVDTTVAVEVRLVCVRLDRIVARLDDLITTIDRVLSIGVRSK
jgi:hypothetical protein